MSEAESVTREVAERVADVRARIADAARRSGRSPADITLVGASKRQPIERIQLRLECLESTDRALYLGRIGDEVPIDTVLLPHACSFELHRGDDRTDRPRLQMRDRRDRSSAVTEIRFELRPGFRRQFVAQRATVREHQIAS